MWSRLTGRARPATGARPAARRCVVLEEGRVVRKVEGRVSVAGIRDTLAPWLQ